MLNDALLLPGTVGVLVAGSTGEQTF
jgi:hypothetical protein